MGKAIDRTGQRFGCLRILRRDSNQYYGPLGREYARWVCKCSKCGSEPTYNQEHFTRIERGSYNPPKRCKDCRHGR